MEHEKNSTNHYNTTVIFDRRISKRSTDSVMRFEFGGYIHQTYDWNSYGFKIKSKSEINIAKAILLSFAALDMEIVKWFPSLFGRKLCVKINMMFLSGFYKTKNVIVWPLKTLFIVQAMQPEYAKFINRNS